MLKKLFGNTEGVQPFLYTITGKWLKIKEMTIVTNTPLPLNNIWAGKPSLWDQLLILVQSHYFPPEWALSL